MSIDGIVGESIALGSPCSSFCVIPPIGEFFMIITDEFASTEELHRSHDRLVIIDLEMVQDDAQDGSTTDHVIVLMSSCGNPPDCTPKGKVLAFVNLFSETCPELYIELREWVVRTVDREVQVRIIPIGSTFLDPSQHHCVVWVICSGDNSTLDVLQPLIPVRTARQRWDDTLVKFSHGIVLELLVRHCSPVGRAGRTSTARRTSRVTDEHGTRI